MARTRPGLGQAMLRVAAVGLLAAAFPLLAFAHALLEKSEPARRAVLSKPPAQVRLWFNERLEPAFCAMSVLDAAGKPVTQDKASVAAEDRKRLELALPLLGRGVYTVRYNVLSVDGHSVRASFQFSIKGP